MNCKKRGSLLHFYLAAFLATIAIGAVLSIGVPLFAGKQLNAGPLFLGSIGALGALFYTPFVIGFGRLIDRFNRRLLLIVGCALFSLAYIIMMRVKCLYQILLIYPLGTIGTAMFWPSIQSWLALDLDRAHLLRSLGIFNVSWSAGWMVGPLLGGFLYEAGYKVPFIFASTLAVLIILLLARQPLILERSAEVKKNSPFEVKVGPAKADAFLHAALVANFATWFFIGIMRNLFPKLGTELGMGSVTIGVLVFCFGLSQTVIFIVLRRTQRWQYRLIPLVAIQSLAILGLLIILLMRSSIAFIPAFVLLGISGGMTYFSSIFYSLYGYLDKGRRSGVHEACIGAGCFFGPLMGGGFSHIFNNLKAPYLAALILMVLAIVVEVRMVKSGSGV